MNRCWYKLPLCLMSCKLKARLASLNNFTRFRGVQLAGGDYCSRSVRIINTAAEQESKDKEVRNKIRVM